MFFLIVAAGLFGNQNPALNIAPLLTWTIWWGGLVVLIMFAGKAWCYVCPWDAVAGWMEKLRFWKKTDDGLGLNLPWPRMFRNILIATILFVGLTWVELGFGVTMKPRVTAYLAIAMLLMAIVSAFLFQRKSFCRFGCLVGRVSGLYALFSGIEIRPRDEQVCGGCQGKECVRGSATAYGCPTFLYPGRLSENTYCIQCGECLQACPEDNLALNLRPWGTDLVNPHRWRTDEAYLALLMLSITAFHGLTMTPSWRQLTGWLHDRLSLGNLLAFTAGMALLMLGPILVYAVLVGISYRLGASRLQSPALTYHDYFVRYAYALLPIALFYHLAHNLEHLLMEGPKVFRLLSDPFGWGWNLLGTLGWNVPPLVSLDVLWILQILLVLVGHVFSLWVAGRTSAHVFGSRRSAFASQIPLLVGMILFSVFSLWLLKQPMEMRTSAM
jgi:polyferredoxin